MYIYPMLKKTTIKDQNNWITMDNVVRERFISSPSARVYLARQTKSGHLVRLKNNLYITSGEWDGATWNDQLRMANRIQVPSYISLLTALAYYDVSSQIPAQRIESIARTRTYTKTIQTVEFAFIKINRAYYNGFIRKEGIFFATPEKALADAIYLCSLGKYALDLYALDLNKINTELLESALSSFPKKTQNWWRKHEFI
ncbi:MAG: hypothetical protein HN915_04630 [Candidatus Marinimicrobia bacterium]|nr:hypothetical protein [Candidatus Neomarinimicrobiota bacterium]MBT3675357.1 hypothetical protein [Candidatus Neomarinimicrobiota bacterium]MBT3763450.1 hypothetical protein [Candidatus Neomarinimicrobiota bacterium]MBT4809645.1 hypothetical protein [Candidatus Neomarinimicrobiota bacterium]MBT6417392.1 hypothetical protein [Candidatus Neomarinimicrobiota bacterium]